jgi:hypothetical protein
MPLPLVTEKDHEVLIQLLLEKNANRKDIRISIGLRPSNTKGSWKTNVEKVRYRVILLGSYCR